MTPLRAKAAPSPIALLFLLLPLLGIFLALLAASLDSQPPPAFQPAPQRQLINYRAPDFELPRLDGRTLVSLADYAGRPLFLNFWATWCAPCIRELPALSEFIDTHAADDQGPALLAIDLGEDSATVSAFLSEIGLPDLPVALDINQVVKRDYGLRGLPTTFVIDGGGMVRYMQLGELTYDEMTHYLQELTAAS